MASRPAAMKKYFMGVSRGMIRVIDALPKDLAEHSRTTPARRASPLKVAYLAAFCDVLQTLDPSDKASMISDKPLECKPPRMLSPRIRESSADKQLYLLRWLSHWAPSLLPQWHSEAPPPGFQVLLRLFELLVGILTHLGDGDRQSPLWAVCLHCVQHVPVLIMACAVLLPQSSLRGAEGGSLQKRLRKYVSTARCIELDAVSRRVVRGLMLFCESSPASAGSVLVLLGQLVGLVFRRVQKLAAKRQLDAPHHQHESSETSDSEFTFVARETNGVSDALMQGLSKLECVLALMSGVLRVTRPSPYIVPVLLKSLQPLMAGQGSMDNALHTTRRVFRHWHGVFAPHNNAHTEPAPPVHRSSSLSDRNLRRSPKSSAQEWFEGISSVAESHLTRFYAHVAGPVIRSCRKNNLEWRTFDLVDGRPPFYGLQGVGLIAELRKEVSKTAKEGPEGEGKGIDAKHSLPSYDSNAGFSAVDDDTEVVGTELTFDETSYASCTPESTICVVPDIHFQMDPTPDRLFENEAQKQEAGNEIMSSMYAGVLSVTGEVMRWKPQQHGATRGGVGSGAIHPRVQKRARQGDLVIPLDSVQRICVSTMVLDTTSDEEACRRSSSHGSIFQRMSSRLSRTFNRSNSKLGSIPSSSPAAANSNDLSPSIGLRTMSFGLGDSKGTFRRQGSLGRQNSLGRQTSFKRVSSGLGLRRHNSDSDSGVGLGRGGMDHIIEIHEECEGDEEEARGLSTPARGGSVGSMPMRVDSGGVHMSHFASPSTGREASHVPSFQLGITGNIQEAPDEEDHYEALDREERRLANNSSRTSPASELRTASKNSVTHRPSLSQVQVSLPEMEESSHDRDIHDERGIYDDHEVNGMDIPDLADAKRAAPMGGLAAFAGPLTAHFVAVFASDRVFKFFPFFGTEAEEFVKALEVLAGVQCTQLDAYIMDIVRKREAMSRRKMLIVLSNSTNPWLNHTEPLYQLIGVLVNSSKTPLIVDVERLFHSCRLNSEVAAFTVRALQKMWKNSHSYGKRQLRILTLLHRMLDRTVLSAHNPIFHQLVDWLILIEAKLDPYRSPKTIKRLRLLREETDEIKKHPLGSIDSNHIGDVFDYVELFAAFQRYFHSPAQ